MHVTGTVIAGQPYARVAAVCLVAGAMVLAGCGGGTAVTELGGPGAPRCQVSLTAEPRMLGADGGSASITVDAARDCTWQATTTASWTTLSPASGQGAGTIAVSVAASQQPTVRTAAISVNGQQVDLSQEARPCQFTLAADRAEIGGGGGTLVVTVTTMEGCTWRASSPVGWIVAPGDSRTGPGTVELNVSANPGAPRDATLTVAGQPFDVFQHAAGTAGPIVTQCMPVLQPAAFDIPATATTEMIRIQVAAGCAWTAASHVSWITIASEPAGQGSATVRLAVAQNTGAARSGTVTVAGQEVTIAQAAPAPVPPPCTFTIDPESRSFDSSGGEGRVEVATRDDCAWSATSSAGWVTFVTSRGTGAGQARYRVQANGETQSRSVTITVAGMSHRITQTGSVPPCTYSLSPSSASFPAAGGDGRFTVIAGPGCEWTAAVTTQQGSPATWISLVNASGEGRGELVYTVRANPATQPRAATITVSGDGQAPQVHGVSQAGAAPACTFAIAPASHAAPAGGGQSRFAVTTQAGCGWSVTGGAPWVNVSAGSGSGSGEVIYSVQANTAPEPRSTTLTVGSQPHTITQAAAAPACTYAIAPMSSAVAAAGGEGRVTVTTQAGCGWSVTGGAPWVNVSAGSGSGSGEAIYSVQANAAAEPRSTTLVVAGQPHTVTQAAAAPACTYSVDPPAQAIPAGGGEGRFRLTTQPGCAWSASGGAGWLSIANPSGSGTADIVYAVQANASPEPRVATIAAGGQTHTITQAGAVVCTFVLDPPAAAIPAAGGEGRVTVTTQPGCGWTATSGAGWLTIAANAGTGPGAVVYTAQANTTPTERNASIVVGGQTHTVTQAGTPPPCTYLLSAASFDAPAAGGEGRFTVQTQAGCAWTAVSTAAWISIVTGAGTGTGDVVYTVQANTATDPRVGSVTVSGQPHTVTQAGAVAPPPPPPPQP